MLILIQPLLDVAPLTVAPRRICPVTRYPVPGPERTFAIVTLTLPDTRDGASGNNAPAGGFGRLRADGAVLAGAGEAG